MTECGLDPAQVRENCQGVVDLCVKPWGFIKRGGFLD